MPRVPRGTQRRIAETAYWSASRIGLAILICLIGVLSGLGGWNPPLTEVSPRPRGYRFACRAAIARTAAAMRRARVSSFFASSTACDVTRAGACS